MPFIYYYLLMVTPYKSLISTPMVRVVYQIKIKVFTLTFSENILSSNSLCCYQILAFHWCLYVSRLFS